MSQNSSRVQQDEFVVYSVVSIINACVTALLKARLVHTLACDARSAIATTSRSCHRLPSYKMMVDVKCVDE
jgi:hypothetical protein